MSVYLGHFDGVYGIALHNGSRMQKASQVSFDVELYDDLYAMYFKDAADTSFVTPYDIAQFNVIVARLAMDPERKFEPVSPLNGCYSFSEINIGYPSIFLEEDAKRDEPLRVTFVNDENDAAHKKLFKLNVPQVFCPVKSGRKMLTNYIYQGEAMVLCFGTDQDAYLQGTTKRIQLTFKDVEMTDVAVKNFVRP